MQHPICLIPFSTYIEAQMHALGNSACLKIKKDHDHQNKNDTKGIC